MYNATNDMMKKILIAMVFAATVLSACNKPVEKPDWFTNATYFEEKNGMYQEVPVFPGNTVMVGDDYIDRGLWSEFYRDTTFKNRGITYDATPHVLYRIDKIADGRPNRIVVSVGRNDVLHGTPAKEIVDNIGKIFKKIHKISPKTKCYWMNIAVCPTFTDEQVAVAEKVNADVAALAGKSGFEVVDINGALREGIANGTCSWDGGKFLNGAGYEALAKTLAPVVRRDALNVAADKEDALEVSDYYKHRVSLFRSMPADSNKIIMLGNSLMNNGLWTELFPMGYIINRGISGDVVEGVDQRLDEIVRHNPRKVFLITGTNDFVNDSTITGMEVWKRYEKLIQDINQQMPAVHLYVMSTLPLNPKSPYYAGFNERAIELNKLLSAASERYGYFYLDIASALSDENGDLRSELTSDGIHLNAAGYFYWAAELAKGNRMMRDF